MRESEIHCFDGYNWKMASVEWQIQKFSNIRRRPMGRVRLDFFHPIKLGSFGSGVLLFVPSYMSLLSWYTWHAELAFPTWPAQISLATRFATYVDFRYSFDARPTSSFPSLNFSNYRIKFSSKLPRKVQYYLFECIFLRYLVNNVCTTKVCHVVKNLYDKLYDIVTMIFIAIII